MSRSSSFPFSSRLSHAVCGAIAVLTLGAAAAPVWATGTAPHAITVQPGQSLNDIAAAATQSRDPTVLANAGRALFDANPQAFMKRDPSRLRLGATLTVPPLDASGAAIVHGASASAAGSAAHAATSTPAVSGTRVAPASHASSPTPAVPGSQVAPAPHAASPAPAVSGAHAAHAASPAPGVSGAQVAPAAHAAPSVAGASDVQAAPAAHAGPATDAGITAKPTPSAPVGVSAAQAVPPAEGGASGPHVWSGAIQSAPVAGSDAGVPSAPAGVPAPVNHASPAPAAAAPQPRPSSLQQLLALKNRVLMELQKHGIGKAPAAGPAAGEGGRSPAAAPAPRPGAAVTADASAASGVPASGGATGAAQAAKPAARPAASAAAPSLAAIASQIDWRVVGGAGGVLAALLAGWAWRRRRQARRADQVEGQEAEAAAPSSAGGAEPLPAVAPELSSQPEASGAQDASIARAPATAGKRAAAGVAAEVADAFAAQHDADPVPIPAREAASVPAQQRPAQQRPTQPKDEQPKDEQPRAERPEIEQPRIEQQRVEQPKPVQPQIEQQQHEQQQDEQQVMQIHNEPLAKGAIDDVSAGQSSVPSAANGQQAFPHDAIEALDSLDMPLPPRTASEPSASESEASVSSGLSLDEKNATNGLASSRPSVADHEPASLHDVEQEGEPLDDDGIKPFTGNGDGAAARPPVLPPLGGAQFGALKLDFDLDLPSVPGAVLPAFTPAELAKIARNKLDLASEYVELGDLSGARTLLQEVLDANDAGTRDDARALMTKLADAS